MAKITDLFGKRKATNAPSNDDEQFATQLQKAYNQIIELDRQRQELKLNVFGPEVQRFGNTRLTLINRKQIERSFDTDSVIDRIQKDLDTWKSSINGLTFKFTPYKNRIQGYASEIRKQYGEEAFQEFIQSKHIKAVVRIEQEFSYLTRLTKMVERSESQASWQDFERFFTKLDVNVKYLINYFGDEETADKFKEWKKQLGESPTAWVNQIITIVKSIQNDSSTENKERIIRAIPALEKALKKSRARLAKGKMNEYAAYERTARSLETNITQFNKNIERIGQLSNEAYNELQQLAPVNEKRKQHSSWITAQVQAVERTLASDRVDEAQLDNLISGLQIIGRNDRKMAEIEREHLKDKQQISSEAQRLERETADLAKSILADELKNIQWLKELARRKGTNTRLAAANDNRQPGNNVVQFPNKAANDNDSEGFRRVA